MAQREEHHHQVSAPAGRTDLLEVAIARSMSVTSYHRPLLLAKATSIQAEDVVDRRPLTPTVVELTGNRHSQRVSIQAA